MKAYPEKHSPPSTPRSIPYHHFRLPWSGRYTLLCQLWAIRSHFPLTDCPARATPRSRGARLTTRHSFYGNITALDLVSCCVSHPCTRSRTFGNILLIGQYPVRLLFTLDWLSVYIRMWSISGDRGVSARMMGNGTRWRWRETSARSRPLMDFGGFIFPIRVG
jgi:hypothetical protein